MWRALSVLGALVAGFVIPLLALVFFLGVVKVGAPGIAGLIALGGALTLLLLFVRGRLRF